MRARSILLAATLIGSLAVVGTSTGGTGAATPPSQRVVMFTDSVGLGARTALPRAFPPDWQVVVDGQPARFVEQLEHDFVRPRLATNPDWFGDHVVIAGGYNYPYWDPERFDRSIDSIVTTLTDAGVKHVHWVTLREVKPEYISDAAWRQIQPYYWYFPTVNEHLEEALGRHPNLRLVDWAAVADRTGVTYDAIHLNTEGAELYSRIVREGVDAAATTVSDESITRIAVPGASGDPVAAVNITTTDPRRNGHLRVWDCEGDPPTVSMHSFVRAQTVAHAGLARLNAAGEFCVFARTSTNLVVDVTGTFTDEAGLGSLPPVRIFDSRGVESPLFGGQPANFGGTEGPELWATTVTALDGAEPGWLRLALCDEIEQLDIASVNHPAVDPTPNLAFVGSLDGEAAVCLLPRANTQAIVDLFAVFTGVEHFELGTPIRWLDTRDGGAAALPAGSVVELDLAEHPEYDPTTDAGAAAIVNISSVGAAEPGFVTGYPCAEDRPTTANLNTPGGVVSNAAILPVDDDGRLCLFNRSSMHLVVDLTGFVRAEAFAGGTPVRVLDTRE